MLTIKDLERKFRAIQERENLNDKTIQGYIDKIKHLSQILKEPNIEKFIKDCDPVVKAIENYKSERVPDGWAVNTKKIYYIAINSVLKYNFVQVTDHCRQKYDKYMMDTAQVSLTASKKNKAPKKVKDNNLTWKNILEVFEKLKKEEYGSTDHLFVAMYVLLRPRRLDEYRNIGVFTHRQTVNEKDTPNYIKINENKREAVLHITKYKTSKTLGPFVKKLPQELVDIIIANLSSRRQHNVPAKTLIATDAGRPYAEGTFGKVLGAIFKKHLGVTIGVILLRRLYLTSLDYNKLSFEQREQYGFEMGHDISTQEKYRMLIDGIESDDENEPDSPKETIEQQPQLDESDNNNNADEPSEPQVMSMESAATESSQDKTNKLLALLRKIHAISPNTTVTISLKDLFG